MFVATTPVEGATYFISSKRNRLSKTHYSLTEHLGVTCSFVVYHVNTCSSYSLRRVSSKLLYIWCRNPYYNLGCERRCVTGVKRFSRKTISLAVVTTHGRGRRGRWPLRYDKLSTCQMLPGRRT